MKLDFIKLIFVLDDIKQLQLMEVHHLGQRYYSCHHHTYQKSQEIHDEYPREN